jgi:ABC-type bacteriocin/lantibiotic exporter with double-glycine peptidase domain
MEVIERVRKILGVVEGKQRFHLGLALVLMVVSAFMDMAGIISMVPFLTAIADVDNIQNVEYLSWVYQYFAFSDVRSFLVFLAMFSFSLLVMNNMMRVATAWANIRISMRLRFIFHTRLFQHFLHLPYTYHVEKNTAELIDKLTVRVNSVIAGTLSPVLIIITHGLTGLFVFITLLWQDFALTVVLIGGLAFFYFFIYRVVQKKMVEYGNEITRIDPGVLKLANESFGGIKELKTLGREASFIKRFTEFSRSYSSTYQKLQIFTVMPNALVELMAIGSIMLLGSYLIYVNENLLETLPILGVYVVASRRIQPAMANIFIQLGQIKFHQPSFDLVWPDIKAAFADNSCKEADDNDAGDFELHEGIEIRGLDYAYKGTDKKIIDQMHLSIPALSTVGIVGGSGVGKTTLVDLILGLLSPSAGEIMVDNRMLITGNRMVGYVPQHVYLADDTVIRNIAFGLDDEEIDFEAVSRAAKLAQVSEFIEKELADKYLTIIGERGIRLSGGQRQRLGIARALYHNPSVIILDEATSSLDGITEQSFMRAVRGLSHKKTIIIIAHRLTTLKDCDIIYLLDKGQVADSGTYDELLVKSAQFAGMANEGYTREEIAGKDI